MLDLWAQFDPPVLAERVRRIEVEGGLEAFGGVGRDVLVNAAGSVPGAGVTGF